MSVYLQQVIRLKARPAGIHLITREVMTALSGWTMPQTGLLNLFLQHTSASLAINENADPDVRLDLDDWLTRLAPPDQPHYRHTLEGSDDLPAHFKAVMLGVSLVIPVMAGRLALGQWQGIYLCEHRQQGGSRTLIITLQGNAPA